MDQRSQVKEYYGEVLKSSNDLKTSCCTAGEVPLRLRKLLKNVESEVIEKFYGCGAPFPPCLEGCHVLDLGCGSGRDVYVLSQLVGEEGEVIGVDMTEKQLEVARAYEDIHRQRFGYAKSNTRFVHGYIEDLTSAGIASESIDVVVSNCVTNLSPEKGQVFREVFRVLKKGGELYFSDVFCDRRLSAECKKDAVLVGECLGGAMYIEDFRRLLLSLGVFDFRVVQSKPIAIEDGELKNKLRGANFVSLTIRAFKLDLEDRCEDYGQVAYYKGTISESPSSFELDNHHCFVCDKPMLICANTADMLLKTRYASHFRVEGNQLKHFGLFEGCAGYTSDKSSFTCC